MDISLLTDRISSPTPTGAVVVRALLKVTGQAPDTPDRPRIGVAFVIDRSGSMGGDRLEAARLAAARGVQRFHPNDVVSAVAFDDEVVEVAPPAAAGEHTGLVDALMALDSGGLTNLSGGWMRGRHHMDSARRMLGDLAGISRRVVLLTDGHANVGITDRDTLLELARTARKNGITTTTIGVGDGYDDDLLRAMADAGGGNAWYVERPDQAHDVLGEELGNLLSVAAQGLTVTITVSEAVSTVLDHSSWPCSSPSPLTMRFDLGDLYASEPKPLLLEFVLPAPLENATADRLVATITVSADVLTDSGGVEHRTVQLPVVESADGAFSMDPVIEQAVLLAKVAKAREEAARQQRLGDALAAEQAMRLSSELLTNSPLMEDAHFAESLQDQARDLTSLAERYAANLLDEEDAKYQMQRSYNGRRGKQKYDDVLTRRPE